ncbi:MAG TPA: DbpA RNA binding domain-containing protein, partial [Acidithiobacillus sp.]|nr:DbpA RNA binding domain-containing protein [Acidithiobacillus sp.]
EDVPMRRFRLDVGESHGAQVKNIVGAIANEAGIPSRNIRKVQINSEHTTVELPADIQPSVLQHLQKVWVSGRPLQIAPIDAGAPVGRASAKPRPAAREEPRAPRKILSAKPAKSEYKSKERSAGAAKRKKPAR